MIVTLQNKGQPVPSYTAGFARNAAQSDRPEFWHTLGGAWLPYLGDTGGQVRDWGGRNNHGTFNNMDPATDWVRDRFGLGIDLQGVQFSDNERIVLPSRYDGLTAWTFVIWLRSDVASGNGSIDQVYQNRDAFGFSYSHSNATFDRAVFIQDVGTAFTAAKLTTALVANTWYCVAGSWDGSTLRAYLNGKLEASATETDAIFGGTGEHSIGASQPGDRGFFLGRFGGLLLYTSSLSPSRIADIYNDPYGLVRKRRRVFRAPVAGADLTRVIGETEEVQESITRIRALTRFIDETETIAEDTVRSLTLTRSIIENENINESVLIALGITRQDSETVSISESALIALGISRQDIETVSISETLAAVLGKVRQAQESLNVSESIALRRSLTRMVNETVQVQEALRRPRVIIRPIAETISMAEQVARSATLIRQIAEQVQITEDAVRFLPAQVTAIIDLTMPIRSLDLEAPIRSLDLTIPK